MSQTASELLRNVRIPTTLLAHPGAFGGVVTGDCLAGDLIVRNGRAVGLQPASEGHKARLVLPRLTEPHVHLDKCHTVARIGTVGGDLHAAITAQYADKAHWTGQDIRTRAQRGLRELIAAGCGLVRTHVDWGRADTQAATPRAWGVLRELAQDHASQVDLQLAPLVGIELLADARLARSIAALVAQAGGALGAFVHNHSDARAGIRQAFDAAADYGIALDFHVDEGLEPGLDGLELIADVALETGFEGPVLCGHACSLMNLQGDPLSRLLDKVARAGLHIVTLPTTNLYLQGRGAGTPDRRGLTRIKEARAAGVNVVVGTDNVRDAFCPIGRHDPIASLGVAVLAAHLDPPLGAHVPMITTAARRALGADPLEVDGAALGDLVVFDAATTSDLLAGGCKPSPLSAALR